MSVGGIGARSLLLTQSLVSMRAQLGDLQRQLGTGKKSDTYAGLGLDRGLTVGLRSHLSAIGSYNDTITNVGVRLELAQSALTRISDIGRDVKGAIAPSSTNDSYTKQQLAVNSLGEILGLLNTQAGDRYLFSGYAADTPSVVALDRLLNGDGTRAGLKQIIDERNHADLGADGLGRLELDNPTLTSVEIAEDAAPSVFGFKLAGISSNVTGATVTPPAGSPPAMSIDFGAPTPVEGETVTLSFTLPDGTSETLTLTATASTTPAPGQFTIGATPTDTANNFETALAASLETLAGTSLTAASAIVATEQFFNIDDANPPQRVDGPPFATATGMIAGTQADTIFWYTGEAGITPARETAGAKVDQSIGVTYGLRATEEAIRWQVQNIAVLAATPVNPADPDAAALAAAIEDRVRPALDVPLGMQKIETIQAELAGAQTTLVAAKDRHLQTDATLSNLLEDVEGVSNEEVAAQILALQTTLQASLQTTAILYQTNILQYI